jgi:hypothetical protein
VTIEEVLPWLVPTILHAVELGTLEAVHCYAADEGDVYAKTAMHAGAGEAHEDAELRGCLKQTLSGRALG